MKTTSGFWIIFLLSLDDWSIHSCYWSRSYPIVVTHYLEACGQWGWHISGSSRGQWWGFLAWRNLEMENNVGQELGQRLSGILGLICFQKHVA